MRRAAEVILGLVLLAAAGCRGGAPPPDEPPGEPPAATADESAARAERALDDRRFAEAAEWFERALAAPVREDGDEQSEPPVGFEPDDDRRFGWRCQAALGWWLAGRPDRAFALLAPPATDRDGSYADPFAPADREYMNALAEAMRIFDVTADPGARGDPERRVEVVPMAVALQTLNRAVRAAAPHAPAPLLDNWTRLERAAELLAASTAMDAGGLDLGEYQIVAVLESWPRSDRAPGAGAAFGDAERPGSRAGPSDLSFALESSRATVGPAVRGDEAYLLGEWIAELAGGVLGGPDSSGAWRLALGVRRGHRVLATWLFSAPPPDSGAIAVVVAPSGRAGARLPAALDLLVEVERSGRVVLDSPRQAELLIEAIGRLTAARPGLAVVPLQGRWTVQPTAAPLPEHSDDQRERLIRLSAGWLALHGWPESLGALLPPSAVDAEPGEPLLHLGPLPPIEP